MFNKILTITLNPSIDEIIVGSAKESIKYISAGGKGVNVARTLNGLGVKVLATGVLGGETGDQFIDLLKAEHIKHDFVLGKVMTRKNVTYVDNEGRLVKRRVHRGRRASVHSMKLFIKKIKNLIKTHDCCVLSGRAPVGFAGIYSDLLTIAQEFNKCIFVDTSGLAFRQIVKQAPFAIKPNLEELSQFAGKELKTQKEIKLIIKDLHWRGIQCVVCSLGDKGVIGSYQNEVWKVSLPRMKIISELGCGDALVGGLICGFTKYKNFRKILSFAVAASASNTQSIVPGLTERKNILQLVRLVRIKRI